MISRSLVPSFASLPAATLLRRSGWLQEVRGLVVRAGGFDARVGDICRLRSSDGSVRDAEVIGLSQDGILLMPFGSTEGLGLDTEVVPQGPALDLPPIEQLIGRVVDARGRPIDRGVPLARTRPMAPRAVPDALARNRINKVFTTGIRSIDALCTIGVGQRVGIFAPAGVGKSVLLGMIARQAKSDLNVIALIGERGREVREFLEDNLGAEGMRRSVVVVATADTSPIERARAAFAATAIAEAMRDQGKQVLLLIDSITRFARAQREIGLARGEPPTRRGFPPSLFTALPQLFERAGTVGKGSVTAFYTVLMEDDATPDPVAEEVRSLLDGHLVLSRRMAQQSIFPAIDPVASLSRLMSHLVGAEVVRAAQKVRELLAKRADIEMLVQVGEFERGHDRVADEALDRYDDIVALLRQSIGERVTFAQARAALAKASGMAAAGT